MSNLKFYRQSRGLSQEQLAVRAGITVRYIAFLESGQKKTFFNFSFQNFQNIASIHRGYFFAS